MKDFVQTYRIGQFIKAFNNGRSNGNGHSNGNGQSNGTPKPMMSGGSRRGKKDMIGTIRNGKMKVQEKPSKWVDVNSGHSYDHHAVQDKHSVEDHPQLSKFFNKMMHQFKSYMNSDELPVAEKLLRDHLEKRHAERNLQRVGNLHVKLNEGAQNKTHRESYHSASDKSEASRHAVMRHIEDTKKRAAKEKREKENGHANGNGNGNGHSNGNGQSKGNGHSNGHSNGNGK